jgi:predicted glycosyltransferase
MQQPSPKRILVCPLDWGLGHATRCIPLIRELNSEGVEVVIASDGPQLKLLIAEFPEMEWVVLPGYNIKYGKKTGVGFKVFIYSPGILYSIYKEHSELKSLIKKHRIDGVISDNRYGLWNKKAKTVLMTHQLNIIAPETLKFAEPLLRSVIRYFAEKFDECWVPDTEGEDNLSGKLSHGFTNPANASYIGLLSRFDHKETVINGKQYDLLALVSGPEPQRTIFEDKLLGQLPVEGKKCLIIRGIPGDTQITNLRSNLDSANHLSANQMVDILSKKPIVVCRSGYSTLMDIAFTGNKAILIPTPGQTEQEYLARFLEEKGFYLSCEQKTLNLEKVLSELERRKLSPSIRAVPQYAGVVRNFIRKIDESDSL